MTCNKPCVSQLAHHARNTLHDLLGLPSVQFQFLLPACNDVTKFYPPFFFFFDSLLFADYAETISPEFDFEQ